MKTYYLDANVVLRYLTGQPEDMVLKAHNVMEKAENGEIVLFLPTVILAEAYWILYSYYEFSRDRIEEVLSQFIRAQGIEADKKKIALEALEVSSEKDVDFVDAFLSVEANKQKKEVASFDEDDFSALSADWNHSNSI